MGIKELIKEVIVKGQEVDLSSSKLFTGALEEFKGCMSYKSTLKGLKDVSKEVAEEVKASKAFLSRANNVLTLASKASEFKLHTLDGKSNIVKLYFYNIERAINLLEYLRVNHDEETVTKIKNLLNKVKKAADKRVYNDVYADTLKSLYKEYKVELTADGKVIEIKPTKEGIDKLLKELEGNEELLEYLKTKLN